MTSMPSLSTEYVTHSEPLCTCPSQKSPFWVVKRPKNHRFGLLSTTRLNSSNSTIRAPDLLHVHVVQLKNAKGF
jgi:hypothetical protein